MKIFGLWLGVQEKLMFNCLFYLSACGHFVLLSKTITCLKRTFKKDQKKVLMEKW